MPVTLETNDGRLSATELAKRGAALLSQQIWCWGRDILREEGNWLIEVGFQRIEAPADRENCASVYSTEPTPGRRVVLRGFGVFCGDDRLGGVFLPRYEFRPKYTPHAKLDCPPWSDAELPDLKTPGDSQLDACVSLTAGLIDWIGGYEATVAERLGTEYRRSTLSNWNNSKRPVVPAEEMADAWRSVGAAFSENPRALIL